MKVCTQAEFPISCSLGSVDTSAVAVQMACSGCSNMTMIEPCSC